MSDVSTVTLVKGSHDNPADGLCLLEAVAFVAGEPHSDHPTCASLILGTFGRELNDLLPDSKRQLLIPLIPLIVGTADDGMDQTRGLMAADWLIRVYTPTWLRLAKLEDAALTLETLPRLATWDDVEAATPAVHAAEEAAREAVADAARAAGYAARDAAWDAARDAAGDAADAAWDAARDAAGDAADAVDAAWYAARAAWAATRASWDAAWTAAGGAWTAAGGAWTAAGGALQPTVDQLQQSAIDLFTAMIRPEVRR